MTASPPPRQSALDRLTAHAPFLARLAECHAGDVTRFLAEGADSALGGVAPPPVDDDIMRGLRQWRGRIALLLALGDLSGEQDVAATTRHLSDFADTACDLPLDRKRVVEGTRVSVRVDLGGRRITKQKK